MLWKKKVDTAPTDSAAFDVGRLSYLDLKELRQRVDAEMAQQFEHARATFQRDFLEKLEEFGLSIEDFKPKRRKRTAAIKYRDPDNPGNIWSGVGRPKKWLQQKLDQGRTLQEFSI